MANTDVRLSINNKTYTIKVPSDTPLLWVLREELKLKGTKFGCGKGLCGACTVHVDGSPMRTCVLPVSAVLGKKITTIDAYKSADHPVQKAWIKHSVPQCGYCQSGQIMQAIGLLESQEQWVESDLLARMDSNLCRCGTYNKIKSAIKDAANEMGKFT